MERSEYCSAGVTEIRWGVLGYILIKYNIRGGIWATGVVKLYTFYTHVGFVLDNKILGSGIYL